MRGRAISVLRLQLVDQSRRILDVQILRVSDVEISQNVSHVDALALTDREDRPTLGFCRVGTPATVAIPATVRDGGHAVATGGVAIALLRDGLGLNRLSANGRGQRLDRLLSRAADLVVDGGAQQCIQLPDALLDDFRLVGVGDFDFHRRAVLLGAVLDAWQRNFLAEIRADFNHALGLQK